MNGYARIEAEQNRQINEEHWRAEADDQYTDGQLADAAAAYAGEVPELWPWAMDSYKPGTRERNLEKAGALWLAEMDRQERAGNPSAAIDAEKEAKQVAFQLDWVSSGKKKTSVLMESTPDGRWVVILHHGEASTACVFPDLFEALEGVPKGIERVVNAVEPDGLPDEIDIPVGQQTFVIGPGTEQFEALASEPENTNTHE